MSFFFGHLFTLGLREVLGLTLVGGVDSHSGPVNTSDLSLSGLVEVHHRSWYEPIPLHYLTYFVYKKSGGPVGGAPAPMMMAPVKRSEIMSARNTAKDGGSSIYPIGILGGQARG
ncbi:uncharacterized protein EI90DRAFT_3056166 [Cantharellus anzutake]|uniref:uncharacterized protein n=1 Tax=Cantharellus anzutake TaxID=1750568 RepID=UPI0019031C69|nr:uncharacterized protein EI90DRAFT_3056166 [Cantharellus anzutake]KAF8331986.1 hypothetical protein EI90DRAFT_3056166 [Cantharellus anzutake]